MKPHLIGAALGAERNRAIGAANDKAMLKHFLTRGTEGVSVSELANKLGLSKFAVKHRAVRLRNAGLIEASHPGSSQCRWGPPGTAQAGLKRQSRGKANHALLKAREEIMARFEEEPIHRIVPALEAAPIGRVGPCSVWELAA